MTTEQNARSPLVFGILPDRKTMTDCDLYLIQIRTFSLHASPLCLQKALTMLTQNG